MKILKYQLKYTKEIIIDEITKQKHIAYYPYIPCFFEWRGEKSIEINGLLDSGADGIVIPVGLANSLNLDLTPAKRSMKIVAGEVKYFLTQANLTIGRAGRLTTFENVNIAVPKEGDTPILIGRNPVFEYYNITFIEPERRFLMEPYEQKIKSKSKKKRH